MACRSTGGPSARFALVELREEVLEVGHFLDAVFDPRVAHGSGPHSGSQVFGDVGGLAWDVHDVPEAHAAGNLLQLVVEVPDGDAVFEPGGRQPSERLRIPSRFRYSQKPPETTGHQRERSPWAKMLVRAPKR